MTAKTPEPEGPMLTEDEREAQRRFQETLGRLVNTPPKPHTPRETQTGKPRGVANRKAP